MVSKKYCKSTRKRKSKRKKAKGINKQFLEETSKASKYYMKTCSNLLMVTAIPVFNTLHALTIKNEEVG
jgi:ligand-binding sensor protein